VVDGEILIRSGDRLDFEALLQRIHPAKTRVDLLADQTPASFVAFDLLADGDESRAANPLSADELAQLERVRAGNVAGLTHGRARPMGALVAGRTYPAPPLAEVATPPTGVTNHVQLA